jgi:hypothetical protein
MVRIVLLAAVIAATLVVVQRQGVLQNAGLAGYCTEVAAPAGETDHWHECRPGKLTGTPELSQASCKRAGVNGKVELWRCPTSLEQNATRQ